VPTSRELRCPHKLHAIIPEEGVVETACRSSKCGWGPGIVVLHRWSVHTGQLIDTTRYKSPERGRTQRGAHYDSASVRSA
jgi:hypothetical protein